MVTKRRNLDLMEPLRSLQVQLRCRHALVANPKVRLGRGLTPDRFRVYFQLREKADPFAVENLDSNNVLETEIATVALKAQAGDLSAVMRKGALETKLLVSAADPLEK